MAAYLVGQIRIHDREAYGRYEAGFFEIFSKYEGEFLAVHEGPVVLEGEWPYTRTVIIRFPSVEKLRLWYDSPEYQALAEHRRIASTGNVILLEGLPSA